jgi:DNA invertase Pin-like site-specific DNA recombinase
MEHIYIRGSDDRINTDNQLLDLHTVAPSATVYEDTMSGSKKRPELERLLQECKSGDLVWIWSLDRLSREGIHETLGYLKRFTGKHVRVRSFKETWLDSDSPCYEIMVSCMAFAAKLERDRLIERTTQGIRRQRLQAGNPVIDKKKILEARAAGLSYRAIAHKCACSAVYALKVCREGGIS